MNGSWLYSVRSYFCVTTNLSKGEPAAHCRGKLWRLVRASMTIVGLVPPVFYQVRAISRTAVSAGQGTVFGVMSEMILHGSIGSAIRHASVF